MAVLGPAKRALLRRLITWDRDRVAMHVANGYDCTLRSRQTDIAEASIDLDPDGWDQDTRFYFMVLLEVTRTPTKAREESVGPLRVVVMRLTLAERLLYRAIADDLGVRWRLRETSPRQWGDVDTEGD